jgi:uncharacterized membrane protein YesL
VHLLEVFSACLLRLQLLIYSLPVLLDFYCKKVSHLSVSLLELGRYPLQVVLMALLDQLPLLLCDLGPLLLKLIRLVHCN